MIFNTPQAETQIGIKVTPLRTVFYNHKFLLCGKMVNITLGVQPKIDVGDPRIIVAPIQLVNKERGRAMVKMVASALGGM